MDTGSRDFPSAGIVGLAGSPWRNIDKKWADMGTNFRDFSSLPCSNSDDIGGPGTCDGGRYLPHHPIRHFAENFLAIDARLEASLQGPHAMCPL